jgi:GAF domain-containing protein
VLIGTSDEAATLRAVISTVFSGLELDEVLAGVVDIATEATGCHACLIYLVEDDRLVLRAASQVHSSLVGRIEMSLLEGVTGWVARTRHAALIPHGALEDPRMKYFPELEEERWQSMAAVPVPARSGEVIGVVVLHTAAPREFTEDDVELLTHTATLVGGAIEDAQLYEEARERVEALTQLAEVSRRLAAATRLERLYEAATAGACALLHADHCQLFRLDPGGRELRLVASHPADAQAPRTQGSALLTTPLVASNEQLGLLCVLRPQRFGRGEEELLRALADQTAMGIERAELIARLTAVDRMRDMFDALAGGGTDTAVLAAAPAGCDLTRRHVVLHTEAAAGTCPDWDAVASRLEALLRASGHAGFYDPGPERLRAVVLLSAGADVVGACAGLAEAEGFALGVSAPGTGVHETRQALREAERAARIAGTLRPHGGALGYEGLGAYKYLADLRVEDTPRDRHWTAVAALADNDHRRRTALVDTLEAYLARRRQITETARALYIHPNTLRQRLARIERVTGLRLEDEDLLALELAVKLVRLDGARRRGGP